MSDLLRHLPKMDVLLDDDRLSDLPRSVARDVAREVLDVVRGQVRAGEVDALPDVADEVSRVTRELLRGRHRRVINATGVVLHTNLGRAPWADEALEAVSRLEDGQRGEGDDLNTVMLLPVSAVRHF